MSAKVYLNSPNIWEKDKGSKEFRMFIFSSYGFLSALDKGIKQDLFSYKCLSDISPITPYGLLRNVSF